MGIGGMYLSKWTPNFSPKNDIPSAVLVWVCLPFLLLHSWNDETLRSIGNTLARFIGHTEPWEGLQAFDQICVEVDQENGLLEAMQLTLDNWTYIHQVDNEQLPFKYKACHEYGHFAKNYTKIKFDLY
jgi:hypothetical protein